MNNPRNPNLIYVWSETDFDIYYHNLNDYRDKSRFLCIVKTDNDEIFGMYTDLYYFSENAAQKYILEKRGNGQSFCLKFN